MILDHLQNSSRYANLHPDFPEAFAFLHHKDLPQLAPGRYEIRGSDVYATVFEGPGRPREEASLEAHRKYLDIQFVLSGDEEMGWRPWSECKEVRTPYDAEKDIEFFAERPQAWIRVPEGCFAVYFPDDAHAPLVSSGTIRKVVVKVAL